MHKILSYLETPSKTEYSLEKKKKERERGKNKKD